MSSPDSGLDGYDVYDLAVHHHTPEDALQFLDLFAAKFKRGANIRGTPGLFGIPGKERLNVGVIFFDVHRVRSFVMRYGSMIGQSSPPAANRIRVLKSGRLPQVRKSVNRLATGDVAGVTRR
jgi:hypothetical protein